MTLDNTIKTRILLRNDTLVNWAGSSLVLGKGELAIATDRAGNLAEIRVGNETTWANSLKLGLDAAQVSGLVEQIQGTAKKYQIVSTGDNSWKLQEAFLSGGNWTDVADSTITVDFSAINEAISAKLDASVFATLSNDIGLSAANSGNKVATQTDITNAIELFDNVMRFKGVVTAKPTAAGEYSVGDVVLVYGSSVAEDNGKEFVLVNKGSQETPNLQWEQIGDQDNCASKTYVDGKISDVLTAASDYAGAAATSALISAKYHADVISANLYDRIDAVDTKLTGYATLSGVADDIATAKSEVLGTADDLSSANTVNGAKKYAKEYADEAVAAIGIDNYIKHGEVTQADLSGVFIFDCGDSKDT